MQKAEYFHRPGEQVLSETVSWEENRWMQIAEVDLETDS